MTFFCFRKKTEIITSSIITRLLPVQLLTQYLQGHVITNFLTKIIIILLTLFRNELNLAHLSESNDKDSMETAAVATVHTDCTLSLRM